MALAFTKLIEDNPDADIELVDIGIRGKNKDKVLMRAETSPKADHAALSADYSQNLTYLESLPPNDVTNLLKSQQSIMEQLISLTSMKPPSCDIVITLNQEQGSNMSEKSSSFNFGDVGGDVAGIAGGDIKGVAGKDMAGVAGGDLSGTVTASIGQLAQLATPEASRLAELLHQLRSAIESDTDLSKENKTKALKQVKALAEACQNPQDEEKKDLADTAITMFKGILTGVPAVAACATAFKELLPFITSVFGLP
jgi:hypothetical protein